MKKIIFSKPGHHSRLIVAGLVTTLILLSALSIHAIASIQSSLGIAGYLDFSYGTTIPADVTGEKPESKLWWNDGIWWGILYNNTAGEYHIYRLDWGNQVWEDTGVIVDEREQARADVLWEGTTNKLYVASHYMVTNSARSTNPLHWGRLYRYTYNPATESYALDVGFPVYVNRDKTEALVLDKDSNGRLWVTYVSRDPNIDPLDYQVYANATTNPGDDTSWGTPFSLGSLFPEAHVLVDDISSQIALQNQLGVMWSNNSTFQFYFATHDDGQAPQNGWALETVDTTPYTVLAEDHINLAKDSAGNVFAAIKTGTTVPGEPLIGLITRDSAGVYSFHVFSNYEPNYETRPIVVVKEDENKVYLFASSATSGSRICYKTADITVPPSSMSFSPENCKNASAKYAPTFIGDLLYDSVNNPTSTKQILNATTGLVVLASDDLNGQMYVHNVMGDPPPVVTQRFPGFDAIGVDLTTLVTATFSKEMKESTLTTTNFKLEDGLGPVAGTVTYDALTRTATFIPDVPLQANTTYTATLNNKVKDQSNQILYGAPETWSFTTALPTVQFSQANYSVAENLGPATIEVTLSAPSAQTVTVDYATSDGTAVAGSDYTAASGTLTFTPGDTSETFTVDFIDDAAVEGNEALNLALTNPIQAGLGLPATASLTIVDDDSALVQFSPVSFTVNENQGTAEITVSLSQSPAPGLPVSVDYATSDGTAVEDSDYTAASGTLTFTLGDPLEKTFTVPIINDTVQEPDETVNLALSNPVNAALGVPDDTATLTIQDNEGLPSVYFYQAPYSEGENAGSATITVALSAPSFQNVLVSYATADGTATGGDYTTTSGTLTFTPGQTSKTFNIALLDDALSEPDETVNLSLSNPVNATLGDPYISTLTILNDDPLPIVQFSAGTYQVFEDAGKAIITVTLNTASGQTVGVDYATSDGTATAGDDYTSTSGTLIFNPGQTSLTFEVRIRTDSILDPNETVLLELSNPDDATLGTPATATLTIRETGFGIYLPIILK